MARPLVHLIDAPVYLFRAYYALPPMTAPDGTPTQAAYGFANTLIKYLNDSGATHLGLAFDHSWESFRNAVEPDYKAQRSEPPEDLAPQFAIAEEVARALGIASYEAPDFEADDCIATLVSQLVRRGATAVVVSSDKDLAQLVREDGRVRLYDLARDAMLDADGVRARWGVDPARIPDFLGLMGDNVDNLPGVPGIGPKSAAALIAAFGSIDGVPADPEAWRGVSLRGAARLARLVDSHRARARRTRELATLRRDVPGLRADLRQLRLRGAVRPRFSELCERLGWGRIATRVPRWAP